MEKIQTDVLIIGSGPAGITAGIYTVRGGLKTTILTGMTAGGQLTTTTDVENYPGFEKPISGFELMDKMLKQATNLGIEIDYTSATNIDFKNNPFVCETDNGKVYESKFVIIATGADARYLGLESETKFKGFGVSGCATCDGNFYKNQDVLVVGGGDTAGTEAIHMSHLAKKVYLSHRRDQFRMEKILEDKIKNTPNIEILYSTELEEVLGQNMPKMVTGVRLKNKKTNEIKQIDLQGVFIAIGRSPASDFLKDSGLEISEQGYIDTKPDSAETNIKGVFAVGDITKKPHKQAIVAAGYGCIAALEIEKLLNN